MANRDTYKYHFKDGNKVIHRGITDDLERREQEHLQHFGRGHLKPIGRRTTRDAALNWERDGGKGVQP